MITMHPVLDRRTDRQTDERTEECYGNSATIRSMNASLTNKCDTVCFRRNTWHTYNNRRRVVVRREKNWRLGTVGHCSKIVSFWWFYKEIFYQNLNSSLFMHIAYLTQRWRILVVYRKGKVTAKWPLRAHVNITWKSLIWLKLMSCSTAGAHAKTTCCQCQTTVSCAATSIFLKL